MADQGIEISRMKHGGWAWRCWACDRNHFGYGDDRDKAAKDAAQHERLAGHLGTTQTTAGSSETDGDSHA